MPDDRKTLVAAAILAAAIGVYLELSRLADARDHTPPATQSR
ncbi:MAG TPA: hypothetical protein VHE30_24230 [Polyangiaceae bacterium]|nr:hypothetical protein [Polyangiaceae bacterium]